MRRLHALPEGSGWVLLPQAVARLTAVLVFAAAAARVDAEQLGALAIATALSAGSVGFGPALVGKPLAAIGDAEERRRLAPAAQGAAVLLASAVGLLLALGAAAAAGLPRLALLGGAVGVPAAMVVESTYWRAVFTWGRRRAGLLVAVSYIVQAAVVVVAVAALSPTAVVLSPSAGLGVAAIVVLLTAGRVELSAAATWLRRPRAGWLPYVYGVAAAVLLAQLVPVLLAVTAGLAAASAYRAAEILFGAVNLLMGVVAQTLLTRQGGDDRPRRTYVRAAAPLVAAAAVNGAALALLPHRLLRRVVGPVADQVAEVTALFTVQRAALGVAVVGSAIVVRLLRAGQVGAFGVASAVLNLLLVVTGAVLGGLGGAVAGLAVAETVVAAAYGAVVRRHARP